MSEKNKTVVMATDRYKTASKGKNSCVESQGNIEEYLLENIPSLKGTKDPKVKINLFLVAIENLASLMSDTPIDILVQPRHPRYELDALIYQHAINHTTEQNNVRLKREKLQKNMLLFGTGIYKLIVYKHKERYKIKIDAVDPRNVVVDPLATQPDEIEYVIETVKYSIDELKKLYPKAKIDVNVDANIESNITPGELDYYNEGETNDKFKKVRVYEMWMKDGTMTKEVDEYGIEHEAEKYPYGRYVVCTDDVLLEDRPNDWACGFPYVFAPCIYVPDRLFGKDIIKDLKPLLNELNMLYKKLSDIIKKTANPQKIVAGNAGINIDNLTNEAGLIITATNVMNVDGVMKWEYPPILPDYFYRFVEKLEYFFTSISGIQDVVTGRAVINSNLPSGRSLEELQAAAQTRLRNIVRNCKYFCYSELGKKIAILVNQIGDTEEVMRIADYGVEEVMSVIQKEAMQQMELLAQDGAVEPEDFAEGMKVYWQDRQIKHLNQSADGVYLEYKGDALNDPNEFEIKVEAGTDIPKSKLDIANVAQILVDRGFIDPQTFFEAIDFPLKAKALQRNSQWQAFLQWQQTQQSEQADFQQQVKNVKNKGIRRMLEGQSTGEGTAVPEVTKEGAQRGAAQ